MTLDPRESAPDAPVEPTVAGRLTVWLRGKPVAHLTPAGGGRAALTYVPESLVSPSDALLSVRLPPRIETYPAVDVAPFLAGLLPEERVKEELARRARVGADDFVGLLAAYGRDCAGAVSIVAEAGEPRFLDDPIRWLTDAELAAAVRELPRAPFGMAVDARVRVSLAGVQGKLLVVRGGDALGLPLDGSPSTHIVKPPPMATERRWPEIAWLELWGLTVLRGAGVSAASAEIVTIGEVDALLVERFDRRRADDGSIVRVHQEDLCQALGVMPSDKYETFIDQMSWRRIAQRVASAATQPLLAQTALLERMVAAVVIGDADLHAKNLTLRLTPEAVDLAPAYDVIPTVAYDDVSTDMALRINGVRELGEVTRDDLVAEAVTWGLGPRFVERRVAEFVARLKIGVLGAEEVMAQPPAAATPAVDRARRHALGTIERLRS